MARVNPVDVIEASYELDLDDQAWLRQLAITILPLVDGGRGAYAYYYDVSTPPAGWLDRALLLGGADRRDLHFARELAARDDQPTVEGLHGHPEPLESAIQAARVAGLGDIRKHGPYAEFLGKIGARDYVAFRTIESGGCGIAVAAPQLLERTLDRRVQRLWARVAAHVAAARRLRQSLQSSARTPEAILTPAGKLEHVEGPARSGRARAALRAAVLRQEQARGKMRRRDPQAATELWTALTSGRWSLVDQFERGGRRYLVARPNEPLLHDPRALTSRENAIIALAVLGKQMKLVAYELGLSESTVSTHLATAMRKLGVKSRFELVRLFALARGR